jgi:hypothetical protein
MGKSSAGVLKVYSKKVAFIDKCVTLIKLLGRGR